MLFFFFKQKTAYDVRISDWSSDVCSSDLLEDDQADHRGEHDGDRHALDLGQHLAGVAVEQALAGGIDRLAGKHTGQDRTDDTADAMDAEGIQAALGRASCRERGLQYV